MGEGNEVFYGRNARAFAVLFLWNKCIRIRMKTMFFQLTFIIFSGCGIDLYVNG